MQAASPLSFAFEVFRWLRVMFDREATEGTPPPDDAPMPESDQSRELGELLGARVEEAWNAQKLDLQQFGQRLTTGLYVWSRYVSASDYSRMVLVERLRGEPALAVEVLRSTLPTAWSLETGMLLDGSIGREQYNQIVEFFNAEWSGHEAIVAALQRTYGDDIGAGDYYDSKDVPLDERISRQFTHIHDAVRAEQSANANGPKVAPETTDGSEDAIDGFPDSGV